MNFAFFLHKSISSFPSYLTLAQRPAKVSTLITGLETNLFHGPNLYASLDVFLAIFLISPQDTKMPFTFVRSFDPGGRGQVPGQTHSWVLHKFRCGARKTSYPVFGEDQLSGTGHKQGGGGAPKNLRRYVHRLIRGPGLPNRPAGQPHPSSGPPKHFSSYQPPTMLSFLSISLSKTLSVLVLP